MSLIKLAAAILLIGVAPSNPTSGHLKTTQLGPWKIGMSLTAARSAHSLGSQVTRPGEGQDDPKSFTTNVEQDRYKLSFNSNGLLHEIDVTKKLGKFRPTENFNREFQKKICITYGCPVWILGIGHLSDKNGNRMTIHFYSTGDVEVRYIIKNDKVRRELPNNNDTEERRALDKI